MKTLQQIDPPTRETTTICANLSRLKLHQAQRIIIQEYEEENKIFGVSNV